MFKRLWTWLVNRDRKRIEKQIEIIEARPISVPSKPAMGLKIVTDLPQRRGLRIKKKKEKINGKS